MRPYTRSVFGADTGLGAFDPASLVLDMGPHAGTPIDPHAFASGHQYGVKIGMRGLGQQVMFTTRKASRLGATMPPVLNPGADPVPQLSQSFVYDPSGAPVAQVTRDQTVSMPGPTAAVVVPTAGSAQDHAIKYSVMGAIVGTAVAGAVLMWKYPKLPRGVGFVGVLPLFGVLLGQGLALRKV